MNLSRTLLILVVALLSAGVCRADAPPTADFNAQVLPIFRKYCVGCHDQENAEGGLVMESYATLLKGGKRGAALVAGDNKRSRMIRMMTGEAEPKMPPKDNQAPTAAELAVLIAWIDAGAKGPQGAAPPAILVTPRIDPRKTPKLAIHAVDFAPDGKLVAIGTHRAVKLVNPQDAALVRTLRGLAADVTSVRFSKDGMLLIAAAGEPGLFGEATLWNVADGNLVKRIRGHRDSLYAAELSPDAKLLATAGYDREIKLWDVATGSELKTLKGHNDAVYGLAFSPDGKMLASASGDRTAKLWNVATGERLETFPQSLKELYTLAFTPDGRQLAAAGVDNRIRIWQISETGKEGTNPILYSRFAHEGPLLRITFSRDGKLLASTAEDRTVKLWEAAKYTEIDVLERQPDWAAALAFAPDNKSLLVGRHDGTLAMYDPATGSKQRDFVPVVAKPELSGIEPRGVQVGAAARIKLTGKNLDDVTEIKLGDPKLSGKRIPDAPANETWVEITAAAGLPRGAYDLSVVSAGGTSAPVKVYVDDLPQASEAEPNDLASQPTIAKLPVQFWGNLGRQGDEDHFAFDAAGGQTIVFDLAAGQIGSKANALLTVYDATGRVVATNNDFDGQVDPLVAFTIPADGRYTVRVRDQLLAGSAEHFYRLSVGAFAYVTSAYPLSIGRSQEIDVELAGYNLPAEGTKLRVKSGESGSAPVPLDAAKFRFRKMPVLTVGEFAEQLEVEPNDAPNTATPLAAPGTIGGRIHSKAGTAGAGLDEDLFRFHAKAGERWMIETDAARRGSPVDTRIEVLDLAGKPIERLLLQATRDSYITFRPIDSRSADVRVKNWEEMELNEFLYMQGEVCKIFRMPQGPDSGFRFYTRNNQRVAYFNTSATTHAMDEPCYIVEPHLPGAKLIPNGLPVFPLLYANDDAGDRKLGTDSQLTFTAPKDADYLIRVTDAGDRSGERLAYRLTVRPPKPDFSVSLSGANPTIAAGSGQRITLTADRVDGFDDDIRVEISGLPPGFHAASPVVIQAGHLEAQTVLTAAADAPQPTAENAAQSKVSASAGVKMADGQVQMVARPVNNLGTIKLAAKPKVVVTLEPAEITIAPGQTVAVTLKIARNGFTDRISFDVENLPHGVIVDNIGLSGVLIPENQTERQIFLNARNWVPETDRPCFAVAKVEGNQASLPVTLHVRKKPALAASPDKLPAASGTAPK